MMKRRVFALLAALALVSCTGRLSAWAADQGKAHSCCPAPAKDASVVDCCPTAAAVHAVKEAPSTLSFVVVPPPAYEVAFSVFIAAFEAAGPPDPSDYGLAVPSRAPPLA